MYGKYALHAFAGQRDITALRDAYAQLNADSPFRVRELDVLPELGPAALLALAATNDGYFAPKRLWFNADDPAATLAEEPAYVDFARDTLTEAARHVAAIHAGDVPIRPIARSRPTTRRSSRARARRGLSRRAVAPR